MNDAPSQRDEPVSANEIEITPEMLESGINVFHQVRDLMYETDDDAVSAIITAVLGSAFSIRLGVRRQT